LFAVQVGSVSEVKHGIFHDAQAQPRCVAAAGDAGWSDLLNFLIDISPVAYSKDKDVIF
jgi:hypothetical protein